VLRAACVAVLAGRLPVPLLRPLVKLLEFLPRDAFLAFGARVNSCFDFSRAVMRPQPASLLTISRGPGLRFCPACSGGTALVASPA